MARRSTAQQLAGDREPSAYPEMDRDADHVMTPGKGTPRRGRWAGGGGRWLIWLGRAVLWAVIVVIVVNGVRAPFERLTQGDAPAGTAATSSDQGFPVTGAASFAIQFAAVYLNFDVNNPQQRAERLAPFLPEGATDQFGWNGLGRMQAGAIQLSHVEVVDANNAVVNLMVQSGGRRMIFSVPIYAADGSFVVSERPALLPAPRAADLPAGPTPESDNAAKNELLPQLEGFFEAYAAGDAQQLQRYVAAGADLEGFNGTFTLVELKDVQVPPGGATREVTAVVVWGVPNEQTTPTPDPSTVPATDPATQVGALEQAYRLTVEKQGDKWFVKDIRGASRYVG